MQKSGCKRIVRQSLGLQVPQIEVVIAILMIEATGACGLRRGLGEGPAAGGTVRDREDKHEGDGE